MYDDSVLPVIRSGQSVLLEGSHAIDDRMLVEPAPGHTPGHVILKLRDGAGRGLFCGDVLHHPVQVYEPTWNTRFCEMPDEARASRRRVLEHCVEHNALLFPPTSLRRTLRPSRLQAGDSGLNSLRRARPRAS